MTEREDEPSQRLPSSARSMWLCDAILKAAVALVIVGGALGAAELPSWLPIPAAVLALAYAFVVPVARYRRWRWELREEELDLLRGVWRVRRTIVPLTRIQHVSIERTGWTSMFGVVRLQVHTAAGAVAIPALRAGEAGAVRDEILTRLRTPDDL